MRPMRLSALIPALAMLCLAGCQAPRAADDPTQIMLHVVDRDVFLDRALTTLREHDFQPRELDRERGVAVAGPTTGKQWFEFWRRDVRGAYEQLEASLHTIRREVTLRLESAGAAQETYKLTVQVDKARFSSPERQVTTASGALGIYSERLPTTEGLRNSHHALDHWIPLGRDLRMESYLLAQIVAATRAEPALKSDSQPAENPPTAALP